MSFQRVDHREESVVQLGAAGVGFEERHPTSLYAQPPVARGFIPLDGELLTSTLYDRFVEMAQRYREQTALRSGGRDYTYGELARSADVVRYRLMRELSQADIVATLLPQGFQFISCLLGALGAGTPYAPFEISTPAERRERMLEAVAPKALLVNSQTKHLVEGLEGRLKILDVDTFQPSRGPLGPARAQPMSPAYLLFTSGSTGQPKAVVDCHRNILHNVIRQTNEMKISSEDVQSLVYHPGVYGGARDIFCALMNGAKLCHYDLSDPKSPLFGEWIAENGITIFCSVASVFRQLSKDLGDPRDLDSVRLIKLGGEATRRTDIETIRALFSERCVVYSGLASTETGTVCQNPISRDSPLPNPIVDLGRPAIGMRVLLRTSSGRPVKPGEIGEILVESDFLSLGYYGDPVRTQEKFFTEGGRRFYRTGDLGRIDHQGRFRHCGRSDRQIKISGNRIDLGEVESALLRQASIVDLIVSPSKDGAGEDCITAYLVPKSAEDFCVSTLRRDLARVIPGYMIPKFLIPMEAFPRTSNGKVDRARLPKPDEAAVHRARACVLSPTEQTLVRIWSELIDCDPSTLSISDGFFDIGGSSILFFRFVLGIRQALGESVPIDTFYQGATIRSIATEIDGRCAASAQVPALQRFTPQDLLVEVESWQHVLDQRLAASRLDPSPSMALRPGATLFVTGSTGYLGANLVHHLLETSDVQIICLVRGPDEAVAQAAQQRAFERFQLFAPSDPSRLRIVRGDLAEERLGMDPQTYDRLAAEVDCILHLGARVHHLMRYQDLEATNVKGTVAALELALEKKPKSFLYMSTLAVGVPGETEPMVHDRPVYGGYGQSKWVSEELVRRAGERGLPTVIFRSPLITWSTVSGQCNTHQFECLFVKCCAHLGMVPDEGSLTKLLAHPAPIDYVVRSICQLGLTDQGTGKTFHLFDPASLDWQQIVARMESLGYSMKRVDFEEWQAEGHRRVAAEGGSDLGAFLHRALFLTAKRMSRKEALAGAGMPATCWKTLEALGVDGVPESSGGGQVRQWLEFMRAEGFLE